MKRVLAHLRQHLKDDILQEISDKMWTIHRHLQSDGRGLSGGTLTEQVLFEIFAKNMPYFSGCHTKQSDCIITTKQFSFKKITGRSSIALNWSKNEDNKCLTFEHPILLLNLREGKWWRRKNNFDHHIPMGFFLLDHVYCNENVRLKKNNKTNSLIDAEDLYHLIVHAIDERLFLSIPPPATERYGYSFNEGFHDKNQVATKKWKGLPFDSARPRFADLFCGVGGFHLALEAIRGRCVFACDIDATCRENYKRNYHIEPDKDIKTVRAEDIPPFEILCAGFPCQPFSKAGDQEGFADQTKGTLFFEILRILKHHRPTWFVLENVKNIISHDKGNTWKVIHSSLQNLEYSIHDNPIVLSPLQYGIPQWRERAFIIGHRIDSPLPAFPYPTSPSQPTHITSVLDKEGTDEYKLSGKHSMAGLIWEEFCEILKEHSISIPHFPIWTDEWDKERAPNDAFYIKYKNWIEKNRAFYEANDSILTVWLRKSRQNPQWTGALRKLEWQCRETSLKNCLWTFRGSGIRVRNLDYSPTLVAMSMIPVYGPEWRQLTPREVCRLQSFPESYEYHPKDCYKQMGNAVNVKVVQHIVEWSHKISPLQETSR